MSNNNSFSSILSHYTNQNDKEHKENKIDDNYEFSEEDILTFNIKHKILFETFIKTHKIALTYIYNNIFKEFHNILNLEDFLIFAFENTTQNERLYKINKNFKHY